MAGRLRERGVRAHSVDGEQRGSADARHAAGPAPSRTRASCACGCPLVRRSTPRACSPGSRPGRSTGSSRPGRCTTPARSGCPAGRRSCGSRPAATPLAPSIDVEARLATLADLPPLVARVRRLFDLDADAVAIDSALAADPRLAASVAAVPGIRVPGCLDPHELVFRALVGQQVSVKAARTALARLAADLGERVDLARRPTTPRRSCSPPRRRSPPRASACCAGPAARIRTIVDVARRLDVRRPRRRGRARARRAGARPAGRARHRPVDGRATWRCASPVRPTCCSRATSRCATAPPRSACPSEAAALQAEGTRWAPWRSYASMHLWRAA